MSAKQFLAVHSNAESVRIEVETRHPGHPGATFFVDVPRNDAVFVTAIIDIYTGQPIYGRVRMYALTAPEPEFFWEPAR